MGIFLLGGGSPW